MKDILITPIEVLNGYDTVSPLYPYIPSLSHWRAWECAAYKRYTLSGRVLDLGCGDGRYFKLLWPDVKEVVGVDMNPETAEAARRSGVYQQVHTCPAHQIPEPDESFDCIFANCSLEHMDYLDEVLAEVSRCLKPGGSLLCSVVTHRFTEWGLIPAFVSMAGFENAAEELKNDFLAYHHLANPLHPTVWQSQFGKAGLTAAEYIPILPRYNSGFFLVMDNLWHLKQNYSGEMGDIIFPFLASNPEFPAGFRTILQGLLEMEIDWRDCSGAVFLVKKATQEILRNCWCGNSDLIPFGPNYGECRTCGTLVSQDPVSQEELIVKDDEADFYGKQYWFSHQTENFGFPDIYARARNDLTERNLHWLKTLLKYRLPPAQVLELGCSHGSFVALLRQAGYQASGVEMSPWVVTYAHETFDIPVEVGPVESLSLPKNSLDIIVLMDVMEHLSDPLITIEHCISLLKSDGLLLIQMPDFKEERSYQLLLSEEDLFLRMMLPKEHLYLFSQRSVKNLLGRLGIENVYFEPPIFDQYDMFLVAARKPVKTYSIDDIESKLLSNPSGRIVLGMFDLRQREIEALSRIKNLGIDLSKHLQEIRSLTQQLEINRVVEESELQAYYQLQLDHESTQARIKAMESSKFWKLRRKWIGLKQKLGLNSKE